MQSMYSIVEADEAEMWQKAMNENDLLNRMKFLKNVSKGQKVITRQILSKTIKIKMQVRKSLGITILTTTTTTAIATILCPKH